MPTPDASLLQSWQHNAQAWIAAVRSGAIESRRQVTDQAILLAVLGRQPERVLDLGCGEGWLLRALAERGIEVTGVDGDETLVQAAQAAGASRVYQATYEQLAQRQVDVGQEYDRCAPTSPCCIRTSFRCSTPWAPCSPQTAQW